MLLNPIFRVVRARDLGRTTALVPVSNLCPNASDCPSIGVLSKDNVQRDSLSATSSRRLSYSDAGFSRWSWKICRMKVRRTSLLCTCRWSVGEAYEDAVWAAVEEHYLPTVPVPVHHNLAAEPDRELLKLPIRGYVQAQLASRRQ